MQRFPFHNQLKLLGIFLLGSALVFWGPSLLSELRWTGLGRSNSYFWFAPTLLEDGWKSGQGNFSLMPFAPASSDSLALGRLITWRAHPELGDEVEISELSHFILQKSRQYEVSPMLVLSLIDVESNFRPSAVSPRGAVGLLQLMPTTAKDQAVRDGIVWNPTLLENPKANIELGLRYIFRLRQQFKTPEQWLTAYNIGPEAMRRKLQNGEAPPREYVDRVRQRVEIYRDRAKRNRARPALWAKSWL